MNTIRKHTNYEFNLSVCCLPTLQKKNPINWNLLLIGIGQVSIIENFKSPIPTWSKQWQQNSASNKGTKNMRNSIGTFTFPTFHERSKVIRSHQYVIPWTFQRKETKVNHNGIQHSKTLFITYFYQTFWEHKGCRHRKILFRSHSPIHQQRIQ